MIHGTYATVTLDEIIQSAKGDLDIENTDLWDLKFNEWAEDALRSLNCQSMVVKGMECLDLEDCKTKLPCGFYKLLGLRFKKDGACSLAVYADTAFLSECGCNVNSNYELGLYSYTNLNYFQINGGYIHFQNGIDFDQAVIAYLKFNVDSDGRIIIYEHYKRALTAYLRWKFMKKKSLIYTRAQAEDERREWIAQQAWIKGEDNSQDFNEYRMQIQEVWNSLVVSPVYNFYGH